MASNQIVEKKTKGQQKIELKRMEDEKARSVTFSKRRKGLFSKVAPLSTMCDAEMAILVVSPSGRVYAFGSPNVHTVVQRYLSGGRAPPPGQPHNYYYYVIGNLHAQLRRVVAQVEAEKKRAAELRRKREELEAKCWMAAPYHTFSRTQLLQVKARLLEISKELTRQIDAFSTSNNLPYRHFYAGGASSNPVLLSPPREIPPPPSPMPMMPWPVKDQNVAFGGNMMAHEPNYGGCNYMGVYGGSSSSNPVALLPPHTYPRLPMPMPQPVMDQNMEFGGNMMDHPAPQAVPPPMPMMSSMPRRVMDQNMMGPPHFDGCNNMGRYG